jgi:3-dehydroquinate dehydratase/shikimate dehydrogenase
MRPVTTAAHSAVPAPPRTGPISIAVQAATAAELFARAEAALADAPFLELRLDALKRPASAVEEIGKFLARHRDAILIATCRRTPAGGAFSGGFVAEMEILTEAARAGCRLVDLALESAEEAGPEQVSLFAQKLHEAGCLLLVSSHDFEKTGDLAAAARRIELFHPDYLKLVSTACQLTDNLAVLDWIASRPAAEQVVGLAMGEPGLLSRVLAVRSGAAFTFASSGQGEQTAPGQVTARTLLDLYRLERIDKATKIYAVAGDPIAHSLSPLMQNTAFRREGLNAVMLPLLSSDAADLAALARRLPLAGAAVTMPLKQEILPHLATMDPLTRRIGASNTLRMGPGGALQGFNTDVAGVVRPLEKRLPLKDARILVVGAGGASRAAVFGLVAQGAQVAIVNRTHAHAVTLAAEAGAQAIEAERLKSESFDVLLNSTPCGMKGSARPLPLEEDQIRARIVFEMIYSPQETPLVQLARRRGLPVVTGLEMFVEQGARQFELWTGKPAPQAEMQRVVELELKRRG